MNNQSSSNGVIIGIVLILIVVIVGFLAYKEGYFKAESEDTSGIQINLGGGEY
jgi:hypothetical protein